MIFDIDGNYFILTGFVAWWLLAITVGVVGSALLGWAEVKQERKRLENEERLRNWQQEIWE